MAREFVSPSVSPDCCDLCKRQALDEIKHAQEVWVPFSLISRQLWPNILLDNNLLALP